MSRESIRQQMQKAIGAVDEIVAGFKLAVQAYEQGADEGEVTELVDGFRQLATKMMAASTEMHGVLNQLVSRRCSEDRPS